MRIPRFVLNRTTTHETACEVGACIFLEGDEHHHLKHVIRGTPGRIVDVLDGADGSSYRCEVIASNDSRTELQIREIFASSAPAPVTLLIGLPKPKTCDFITEKAVEIGVRQIRFFCAERSQGHRQAAEQLARRERLERVANAALKQSGATFAPIIGIDENLEAALKTCHETHSLAPAELRLILSQYGGFFPNFLQTPLSQPADNTSIIIDPLKIPTDSVKDLEKPREIADSFLIVGPEGGLSDSECALAKRAHYERVSLGHNTLRTETATVVAAALLAMLCSQAS